MSTIRFRLPAIEEYNKMLMRGLSLVVPKLLNTSTQKSEFQETVTQPYIDMAAVHVDWAKLQPSKSETDFSIFDAVFDLIPDRMDITLGIHAADDVPPWLLDVSGGPLETLMLNMTKLAHHDPVPVNYPIPYTASYATAYIDIHRQVANYLTLRGLMPRVQGICVGWTHGGDLEATCLSRPASGSPIRYDSQWLDAGYSDLGMLTAMSNGAKAISKLFPDAFPYTPMLSPKSSWPRMPGTEDTMQFVETIASTFIQTFDSFGMLATGLTTGGKTSRWLTQLAEDCGVTPLFQTNEGEQQVWTPAQAQQALLDGVSAGADYIEIFSPLAAQDFILARNAAYEAIAARTGPF